MWSVKLQLNCNQQRLYNYIIHYKLIYIRGKDVFEHMEKLNTIMDSSNKHFGGFCGVFLSFVGILLLISGCSCDEKQAHQLVFGKTCLSKRDIK